MLINSFADLSAHSHVMHICALLTAVEYQNIVCS